ncbi:hypothetical protein AAC387_Pa11g0752 [Persea americana]
MAYKWSNVLPQASLVDICRNNMRARICSMIIGNKSKNLGELLEASMEAETVIKDLNSQKSSKKEPTAIRTSKPKKRRFSICKPSHPLSRQRKLKTKLQVRDLNSLMPSKNE